MARARASAPSSKTEPDMSRYWSDTVRRLTPYVPGEQRAGADIVKLNTNENPYPPSPRVLEAIAAVGGDALRRYPDPESSDLRAALASAHGLTIDEVFVGNGSDEVLALAFMAYFSDVGRSEAAVSQRAALQFPEISYSFYPVYCGLYGTQMRTVPLEQDFSLELTRFEPNASGICFPNPNAPTGRAVPRAAIRALLDRHTESILLVDEAYADFGVESAVPLIHDYPNLLVSHTFSKGRSLAGLRIGAAFGSAEVIAGLRRVKNSFNSYPVDAVAEVAGIASLGDPDWHHEHVAMIVATRERFSAELVERGFTVLPSAANFVFARPRGGAALDLFCRLDAAGVLVRHWDNPGLAEWLRISIGTDSDMRSLLDVLDTDGGACNV